MSAQFIEHNGKAAFAVVPVDEYNRLIEMVEDMTDAAAFDRAVEALAAAEDELVPGEIVARLINGDEHPLKIWREFRGLTQVQLAEQADGVQQSQIAQIETGRRAGAIPVLKSLAGVLSVDLDDLVAE